MSSFQRSEGTPTSHWLARILKLAGRGINGNRELTRPVVSANAEIFSNLTEIARQVEKTNRDALFSLIKLVLRPLQAEQMLSVAEREQHAALDLVDLYHFFSNDAFFSVFERADCICSEGHGETVDLSKDIVLPTPWERDRFVASLTSIGVNQPWGPWTQDYNHKVDLILPWRLALVHGGNHSITAGILSHQGVLKVSSIIDLTPLLARVRCDGDYYIDCHSNKRVGRVKNGRVAAVFEIGRLLIGDATERIPNSA